MCVFVEQIGSSVSEKQATTILNSCSFSGVPWIAEFSLGGVTWWAVSSIMLNSVNGINLALFSPSAFINSFGFRQGTEEPHHVSTKTLTICNVMQEIQPRCKSQKALKYFWGCSRCCFLSHTTVILLNEDNPLNQACVVSTKLLSFYFLIIPIHRQHVLPINIEDTKGEGLWIIEEKEIKLNHTWCLSSWQWDCNITGFSLKDWLACHKMASGNISGSLLTSIQSKI